MTTLVVLAALFAPPRFTAAPGFLVTSHPPGPMVVIPTAAPIVPAPVPVVYYQPRQPRWELRQVCNGWGGCSYAWFYVP